jgi:YD repeat-containing protein
VKYIYDDYKRVIQVQKFPVSTGAEDYCQRVTLIYDSHPWGAPYGDNGLGKLVKANFGCYGSNSRPFEESYSYNPVGQMTRKELWVSTSVSQGFTTVNTYDDEGKMTGFTNPGDGQYAYGFDAMGRPVSLTKGFTTTMATGGTYNAAGQLTGLTYGNSGVSWTETNTYNTLGQLTRRTIPGVIDFE